MGARINGEGYFQVETSGGPENMETLTDKAIQKVLDTLQTSISLLVDQENDRALTALQACVGALFKRAAECRAEGKRMDVE